MSVEKTTDDIQYTHPIGESATEKTIPRDRKSTDFHGFTGSNEPLLSRNCRCHPITKMLA